MLFPLGDILFQSLLPRYCFSDRSLKVPWIGKHYQLVKERKRIHCQAKLNGSFISSTEETFSLLVGKEET